jgi:hypothetical protein
VGDAIREALRQAIARLGGRSPEAAVGGLDRRERDEGFGHLDGRDGLLGERNRNQVAHLGGEAAERGGREDVDSCLVLVANKVRRRLLSD